MADWYVEFGQKMVDQSGNTMLGDAPWRRDLMVNIFVTVERAAIYALSYSAGYIAEQIVVGAVAGGVGRIGVVLFKGGSQIAAQLARRTLTTSGQFVRTVKEFVAGALNAGEKQILDDAVGVLAKTQVNVLIKTCPAELLENYVRIARDAFLDSPNLRNYALRSGSITFWKWLALFEKLMAGEATDAMRQAFLKVMDKKLIIPEGQGHHEWVEDFFLSLAGNSSRLNTRPALASLSREEKDVLIELLRPGGSIWTSPPIGSSPAGVLCETELANTVYRVMQRSATAPAVDFTLAPIAIQVKSTASSNPLSMIKKAMEDLSRHGDMNGLTQLTVDVRYKKDCLDVMDLQQRLDDFVVNNPAMFPVPVTVEFSVYEFVLP